VVLLQSGEGALVVGRTRFHCTKMSKLHSGAYAESLFAILGFSVLPMATLFCVVSFPISFIILWMLD
jgi:hypothetical protein